MFFLIYDGLVDFFHSHSLYLDVINFHNVSSRQMGAVIRQLAILQLTEGEVSERNLNKPDAVYCS